MVFLLLVGESYRPDPRKWSIPTALGADLLWQTRIHQGISGTTIRRWPWKSVWCSVAAQLPFSHSHSLESKRERWFGFRGQCHFILHHVDFNPAPSPFTATTGNSYDELATSNNDELITIYLCLPCSKVRNTRWSTTKLIEYYICSWLLTFLDLVNLC